MSAKGQIKSPDDAGASTSRGKKTQISNWQRRGAAPVEAVINPALHYVDPFCGAYERCEEGTTGFNVIVTKVSGTEVNVVILDLRGPTRREAPFDASPDDPTAAIGTAGACLKQSPVLSLSTTTTMLWWHDPTSTGVKPSQLKPARGGLTAAQVRRVKELIDARISTDVTISDLAVVAELSQFHFIRAFKESVELSPYQYILSERVRRAKELLSKSDLSISDVALAAGFHNAYQMNRVFRKLVGLTPTALRRQTGVVSP